MLDMLTEVGRWVDTTPLSFTCKTLSALPRLPKNNYLSHIDSVQQGEWALTMGCQLKSQYILDHIRYHRDHIIQWMQIHGHDDQNLRNYAIIRYGRMDLRDDIFVTHQHKYYVTLAVQSQNLDMFLHVSGISGWIPDNAIEQMVVLECYHMIDELGTNYRELVDCYVVKHNNHKLLPNITYTPKVIDCAVRFSRHDVLVGQRYLIISIAHNNIPMVKIAMENGERLCNMCMRIALYLNDNTQMLIFMILNGALIDRWTLNKIIKSVPSAICALSQVMPLTTEMMETAVKYGNMDSVQQLVYNLCPMNVNVLRVAIIMKHHTIARWLYDNGAPRDYTTMKELIRTGDIGLIHILYSPDIVYDDMLGDVVDHRRLDIIKFLLS